MDVLEPRQRDAAQTKSRILHAAQRAFTQSGYSCAGLREIAAAAGVASSLIVRYFGTKAGLFEAALLQTIAEHSVFTSDKEGFGETMTRLAAEKNSIDITVMLMLALADPEARAVAVQVARRNMIKPLAEWLGPPHAMARAENMFALLTGAAIQNQGIGAGLFAPQSAAWLARTLQVIVDEGDDRQIGSALG
jgi:AcrR family transcriptional regulator